MKTFSEQGIKEHDEAIRAEARADGIRLAAARARKYFDGLPYYDGCYTNGLHAAILSAKPAQDDGRLKCDICGNIETPPYADGDACYCGGHFKPAQDDGLSWPKIQDTPEWQSAQDDDTCAWWPDDLGAPIEWEAACGFSPCFEEALPIECGYVYCPKCGRRIEYREPEDNDDEEAKE